MRAYIGTAVLSAAMLLASQAGAVTIAEQDFDGPPADTFGFTASPAAGANVWGAVASVGGAQPIAGANTGTDFWGGNDTNGLQSLSFGPLDISGFNNVQVSFFYDLAGTNGNDSAQYSVNGGAAINLATTAGWSNVTITTIADSAITLDLDFTIEMSTQGGNNDATFGLDTIVVTGDPIAPEVPLPASALLLGTAVVGLGLSHARTRRASRRT